MVNSVGDWVLAVWGRWRSAAGSQNGVSSGLAILWACSLDLVES